MGAKIKRYKLVILLVIVLLVVVICVAYRSIFYKKYEEAKRLSQSGKYMEAYFLLDKFPIILGNKQVKNNIDIIKVRYQLGSYKEFAKSNVQAIKSNITNKDDKLNYWIEAVNNLYKGLEEAVNYNAVSEEEKRIKVEFITIYYFNLYQNLPKFCIQKEFIEEINSMKYEERIEKLGETINNLVFSSRYINKFDIHEPYDTFKAKLFDSNDEFHYPKVLYTDKSSNAIESDLVNEYKD